MKIKLKNSILLRLFTQITIIIVTCALTIILCNAYFLESYYNYNVRRTLESISEQIDEMGNVMEADNLKLLYDVEVSKSVNIKIIDKLNTIYDTTIRMNPFSPEFLEDDAYKMFGPEEYKPFFKNRNIVESREESKKGGYFEVRRSVDGTSEYLVYINKLSNGNMVEISHQKELISESARLANSFIIPITVITFLLSIVWIYIYSKHWTKPLIDMSNITERMSKLDFSQRCKANTKDEIGKLGSNINYLSDTLDVTLNDLKAKNKKLRRDIEYERKLEEQRKAFISNVSHELKTPISIIQGYAEGLKVGMSEDPESFEKYCSVIIDESEKMNNLVLELLELSRYDSDNVEMIEDNFSISEFVRHATEPLSMRMGEKGITCICDIDESFIGYGSVVKLDRVITNYVSNAISHAEGEKIIKITCEKLDRTYRLKVFNTGKHIADEDMENIWLSFYRGDKSHNRDSRRFGLGLSIVKAITKLHGTDCGVDNVDDGVEFWFDIKIGRGLE